MFVQISMLGQEQKTEVELDKTYGYIKSQELLALKIQQNYPELGPRIERATQLFYSNFGPGLKRMDQEIRSKYKQSYPELSKKLINLGNDTFKHFSKESAERFLQSYEQMSVGRIKSPYLETLLAHQFGSLALTQYFRSFNKEYSVSNFTKDELLKIKLRIPNNWSENYKKDHKLVLKKFQNDLGNGNIILNVVKTGTKGLEATPETIPGLLTELVPKNAIITKSTKKSMGNGQACFVNFIDRQASINSKIKRNVSLYIVEQADQLLILDFSIYIPNEDTNNLTNDIGGLFDQIVSTIEISKQPYKRSLVSNKL